ncbi:thioredoxin family protein [Streptomyces sp. NPDC003077]|uniref:thioredoxin family protein n=1 Tax=Streptomyces sp. NPDC003077 TaxID=3154443 RepID=UPI0033A35BBD
MRGDEDATRRDDARADDGRPPRPVGPSEPGPGEPGPGGTATRLAEAAAGQLGPRATLVQFSTAFCQPCRATRRTLAEVADMVDGVTHLEIDAEAHLDLVRDLRIARTPTVLVLDADGTVVRRAAGMPRKVDVIAALGAAVRD